MPPALGQSISCLPYLFFRPPSYTISPPLLFREQFRRLFVVVVVVFFFFGDNSWSWDVLLLLLLLLLCVDSLLTFVPSLF